MILNLLKGLAFKSVKNLIKMFNSVPEPLKSVQTSCVRLTEGVRNAEEKPVSRFLLCPDICIKACGFQMSFCECVFSGLRPEP